ncbi:hypothetical protein B566_EDAN001760 [Ephemera danica]|nr:hypothetical protein B566_EDAN001760 [Ephemera danica]
MKTIRKSERSSQSTAEMTGHEPEVKLVAPDGGWGWVIVFSFAITHFFTVPMFTLFGLIFGEKCRRIGITATDISLILNINSAIGFGFGMMNRPLLRRFTYRQVSMVGSILVFLGTLLTAVADSMPFYILSFGIIFALGFSTTNQPQMIAMHTYFLRFRGRAMSLGVTACGFGPVLIPLLAGQMLEWYTPEGTMLVISALVLHSLPASALLHPVSWHMKIVPVDTNKPIEVVDPDEADLIVIEDSVNVPAIPCRQRTITVTSVDLDCHSIFGLDVSLPQEAIYRRNSNLSSISTFTPITSTHPGYRRSVSQQPRSDNYRTNHHLWSSENSLGGSMPQVFEDVCLSENPADSVTDSTSPSKALQVVDQAKEHGQPSLLSRMKSRIKKFGLSIVDLFDLRLLFMPGYFVIIIGMSVALFSEINFSMLFPFVLNDLYKFSVSQVAVVLALMATTDILARFIAPYIAEALRASHKAMYLASLVMHVTIRCFMMIFLDYTAMLVLAATLGLAKGVRAVFMPLVIPSHVPLERLPAAMGLQMVFNAILFLSFGPLMGVLRDVSGSYILVLLTVNILTLSTVVLWTWRSFFMWTRGYCKVSSSDP